MVRFVSVKIPRTCYPDDEEDDGDKRCSLDITDTQELSRRLLDILSKTDPAECEEELKKLKEELAIRS